MKCFQWATPLLLLILTQCAHADSISTFVAQANITFLTNFGSGDNQGSTFTGPGVNLRASGDVSCFWCNEIVFSLTPGSSLTPSVGTGGLDFTFVQGIMTFGGQPQACNSNVDCGLSGSGITALRSFTFPTNGRNFTVTIPATLTVPIGGLIGEGPSFQQFDLQIPPGRLVLTFDFFHGPTGPDYYQFSQGMFTTTPEPSTLILMASGFAGIVGTLLRKRNCKR